MVGSMLMPEESSEPHRGPVTGVIHTRSTCKLHAIPAGWNTSKVTTGIKRSASDILVIDDDAIMRDLVADWLEAAGYAVRKATRCRAWIGQILREGPPGPLVDAKFTT